MNLDSKSILESKNVKVDNLEVVLIKYEKLLLSDNEVVEILDFHE